MITEKLIEQMAAAIVTESIEHIDEMNSEVQADEKVALTLDVVTDFTDMRVEDFKDNLCAAIARIAAERIAQRKGA